VIDMTGKLSPHEIDAALIRHPGWSRGADEIIREWVFESFRAAIEFVNRVADVAEAVNHHPDIEIRYTRVSLRLSSHDKGGVTPRDLDLAARIDGIG
jgi:4a-hydroxytetrahydrobiopterin dehydratase